MQGLMLEECDLVAYRNSYIAPLCTGKIRHNMYIEIEDDCTVLLVGKQGVFDSKSLIIISYAISEGTEIMTEVFNISNHMIRVLRGTAISRLVSFVRG